MSESVERLKAASRRRSVFSALARQEAVGTVKESRVSLQRAIPMVGNSFKPFFRGRFIERNGKVVLVGRFTIHWFTKAFMAVWFGSVACSTLVTAILGAFHTENAILGSLFGLGMIAAGTALVWICRWFARNDAAWLTDVIRQALNAQVLNQPTPTGNFSAGDPSSKQPSTPITVVAVALMLMAVMCWSGAIFGIQSGYTGPNGFVVTYFPNMLSRYVAASIGTAMLALAFGVYRRRLLAWRAGFALLAGSWVYSIAEALSMNSLQTGHGMAILFCVLSLVVIVIWIRWWYAQRASFR